MLEQETARSGVTSFDYQLNIGSLHILSYAIGRRSGDTIKLRIHKCSAEAAFALL